MRPEEVLAALRARSARARAAAREAGDRLFREARRRPDAVIAFALGMGVLAMILHWW